MDGFPHLALGVLGTLALALILVLVSASALQAWHSIHQHRLPSVSVEIRPPAEGMTPASSYWSGRS